MLRQLLLSEFEAEVLKAKESWAQVAAQFPSVTVQPLAAGVGAQVLRLDVEEWLRSGFEPSSWDARVYSVAGAERLALHLVGAQGKDLARAAREILTRYQGLIARRNTACAGPVFDCLLERHRTLHDMNQAHGRAHYQHSLDTWQWVLRLEPEADLAVQVAALFHEVEGPLFEGSSPARSADMARELLAELGVELGTRERVCRLLTHDERTSEEAERALLDKADNLSFFSLHTSDFIRFFGSEHARRHGTARLGQLHLTPRARPAFEAHPEPV
ncbi:MAG TPA: hypothetical protein VF815_32980 [Myxococcaceae bacterium]|jgi:hypothetical protein